MRVLGAVFTLLCAFLQGCSAVPGYGLSALDVSHSGMNGQALLVGYHIVELDKVSVARSNLFRPLSIPLALRNSLGVGQVARIGIGDKLTVNVWEPSADGVFATAEKKQVSVTVSVDEDGMIYMPYAGRLRAQGQSVNDIRLALETALRGKAVEPQVQIILEESVSNTVVIVGDVTKSGQYIIPSRGLRLLDALAQAGGTRAALFESMATITRGPKRGSLWLDQVAGYPRNNILLMEGDTVVCSINHAVFQLLELYNKADCTIFRVNP